MRARVLALRADGAGLVLTVRLRLGRHERETLRELKDEDGDGRLDTRECAVWVDELTERAGSPQVWLDGAPIEWTPLPTENLPQPGLLHHLGRGEVVFRRHAPLDWGPGHYRLEIEDPATASEIVGLRLEPGPLIDSPIEWSARRPEWLAHEERRALPLEVGRYGPLPTP